MTDKKYISLDVIAKLMGELPDRVIAQAKTLDEHQVAEIEAMRGYMGHSLIEDNNYDDDEYLLWVVANELEEDSFKSESAFLDAHRELADSIRIEAVGSYFVAINKNA